MVNIKINGIGMLAEKDSTILETASKHGIKIPTLCYFKGLNEIGACRVCVVELVGNDKLITACNNKVVEGMEILTDSPKVREAKRTNIRLILSQHDCHCATCVRSRNCELQNIANDLGMLDLPYGKQLPKDNWVKNFYLVKDNAKCIKCMRCVQVCDKIQTLNIWDIAGTGSRTTVDVSRNRKITETDCSLCGQCITHCPVGALRERDDTEQVYRALSDPNKITVVQIAPAIRSAWGENLGLTREFATANRLVGALRKLGFDYIFDTDFSADMTIMEEASELIQKLQSPNENQYPLMTSCCPGWVRFIKSQYPEMVEILSTAKSPHQMFGAIAKSYYAQLLGVNPSKLYVVSIMPCLAKKSEIDIATINSYSDGKDVDVVLTTREMVRMLRGGAVNFDSVDEEEFDMPLGISSGAGIIFGVTGGVMEAALRTGYYLATGNNPPDDAFAQVRGNEGWKEAIFDLAGTPLKVAVVSGLGNARKLMEAIVTGKAVYDFVEVMACSGGCANGGGQPIHDNKELDLERGVTLYALDKSSKTRFSHENPSIVECYSKFIGEPLGHTAHNLLHTDHSAWELHDAKK